MKRPFWVWPPLRIWVLFLFSLALAATAYLTTREGLRFVSRPLHADEERVVQAALNAWDQLTDGRARKTTGRLREMAHTRKLRAMHGDSFARSRERSTFGYTDERGRMLLNPRLCFGSLSIRGSGEVYAHDLVVTLSTLVHEEEHYTRNVGEREAYRAEWQFLRRSVLVARSRDLPYRVALERWEGEISLRLEENLGPELARQIESELDAELSYERPTGSR